MTARARNGRFTAERTTQTTTVTERVTVEQAPPCYPGDPTPVFTRLMNCPPEGARWAHPGFFLRPPLPVRAEVPAAPPPPVVRVPVPREYAELHEDTLAHEFTDADRERLAEALGGPDAEPLELTLDGGT